MGSCSPLTILLSVAAFLTLPVYTIARNIFIVPFRDTGVFLFVRTPTLYARDTASSWVYRPVENSLKKRRIGSRSFSTTTRVGCFVSVLALRYPVGAWLIQPPSIDAARSPFLARSPRTSLSNCAKLARIFSISMSVLVPPPIGSEADNS